MEVWEFVQAEEPNWKRLNGRGGVRQQSPPRAVGLQSPSHVAAGLVLLHWITQSPTGWPLAGPRSPFGV